MFTPASRGNGGLSAASAPVVSSSAAQPATKDRIWIMTVVLLVERIRAVHQGTVGRCGAQRLLAGSTTAYRSSSAAAGRQPRCRRLRVEPLDRKLCVPAFRRVCQNKSHSRTAVNLTAAPFAK